MYRSLNAGFLHYKTDAVYKCQIYKAIRREKKLIFFRFFHWDLAKMKRIKAFDANLFNSQWERKHWRTCILAVCKWDRKSSIETFILGPTYMYIYTHHTYIDISLYIQHTALTAKQKCIVVTYVHNERWARKKTFFNEMLQICLFVGLTAREKWKFTINVMNL